MRSKHVALIAVAVAALAGQAPLSGAGPSFHPDTTFKGSSLTGWHAVGAAAWRAENGELVGTPQQPEGGWLMLDRPYQDVGFYASFQCAPGCRTGVMLRAEKTAGGMKGIYMALTDGDPGAYRVTLDERGRMLTREPLRFIGGQLRIAPPPDPNAPA
ncbi:MAG: DUF1080 domain-containing protein, partial [Acidobacteria bacterium]